MSRFNLFELQTTSIADRQVSFSAPGCERRLRARRLFEQQSPIATGATASICRCERSPIGRGRFLCPIYSKVLQTYKVRNSRECYTLSVCSFVHLIDEASRAHCRHWLKVSRWIENSLGFSSWIFLNRSTKVLRTIVSLWWSRMVESADLSLLSSTTQFHEQRFSCTPTTKVTFAVDSPIKTIFTIRSFRRLSI